MKSLWSLWAKGDAKAHSVRRTHDWNWRLNQWRCRRRRDTLQSRYGGHEDDGDLASSQHKRSSVHYPLTILGYVVAEKFPDYAND